MTEALPARPHSHDPALCSRRSSRGDVVIPSKTVRIKRFFLGGLVAVLVTPSLAAQNLVIFSIDSCRSDRFGVYGREPSPTPNIDRWAKTGTVFRNAYSTSAWTAPGLVSIMSGLYPPVHAVNNRDQTGSEDMVTLIKLLRGAGYRVPNLIFFSFVSYFSNLGLGPVDRNAFGRKSADEVFNWLQREAAGDRETPFFLWYHTTVVHQPYRPPARFLSRPIEEFEERDSLRAVSSGAIVPQGSVRFEPEDRPLLDELYDGEMRRADEIFGRLLETLKDLGLLKDTLIVLTADHGEELLDHGFVGHASTSLQAKLYEELIRIPLIFSWPGKAPVGKVEDRLASQIDVMPTVLSLLGRPVPADLDGIDLFSEKTLDRSLFFESVIAGNQTSREREDIWVRAVRKGPHKFISTGELYDLESDPSETRNLIKKRPQIAAALEAELDAWLRVAVAKRDRLFPHPPERHSSARPDQCPRILVPRTGQKLSYKRGTGLITVRWEGDMQTTYLIEYDIGAGDHHVAGEFEVDGNHQLFGPLQPELWENLKAWNPFRIRVSPLTDPRCWSAWVSFKF